MNIEFFKMHGTGNDFIVVDNFENHYNSWESRLVREICQRRTGVGADGLLVLEKSNQADFRMRYYNSDGKESEMCVNGSRCISYFALTLGYIKNIFKFEAGDGLHNGRINSSSSVIVEVKVNKVNTKLRSFPVDFKLQEGIYFRDFINTGVPHIVLECTDIDNMPVADLGSQLRFHPYYKPDGTNVNFAEVQKTNSEPVLRVRTFERGVDAETLSCGTGATASALSFVHDERFADKKIKRIKVKTRGGNLIVHLKDQDKNIYLEGPVEFVYKGIYSREDYS